MASTSSTTTTTVTHPDGTVIETTTTTSEGAPEGPAPVTAASLAACADPPLPTDKLLQAPPPERQPVVIVSCGSFSPPTLLHLRIFEDAKVHLQSTGKYTVVGGYLSPVHAAYGKKSLADMHHRINMAEVPPPPTATTTHHHAAPPRPAPLPSGPRPRGPAPPHSSRGGLTSCALRPDGGEGFGLADGRRLGVRPNGVDAHSGGSADNREEAPRLWGQKGQSDAGTVPPPPPPPPLAPRNPQR